MLHDQASHVGFELISEEEVAGRVALDGEFLTRLEAKCSSAMRLMASAAHAAGMARARAAGARGEQWLSYYDVLIYAR
jgi:hypothetical protein